MTDKTRMEILYLPTANGQKANILLEETGMPYMATRVTRDWGAPPAAPSLCSRS